MKDHDYYAKRIRINLYLIAACSLASIILGWMRIGAAERFWNAISK
jgi:hypothetical protein